MITIWDKDDVAGQFVIPENTWAEIRFEVINGLVWMELVISWHDGKEHVVRMELANGVTPPTAFRIQQIPEQVKA